MLTRCKSLIISFIIMAAVLLKPVSVVFADDGNIYNSEIPFLQGIDVKLERNDGWKVFDGFLTGIIDKQRSISFINFEFDKLNAVDYTKYELIFDFELKSLLDDNTVSIHQYQYVSNIDESSSPGFFDNLLISLNIKDDYFCQNFSYPNILKQSKDFQQKVDSSGLANIKGLNSYNTVISQVECYLREKSSGNYGLKSRFKFTWNSDFWNQLCNNITYELVVPDSGEILVSDSVSDVLFAGSLDSEGNTSFIEDIPVFGDIYSFFVDLPAAIIAFITGFVNVIGSLSDLILVVFPFLPGGIVNVLILMIFFILLIALYKLVQGWFG